MRLGSCIGTLWQTRCSGIHELVDKVLKPQRLCCCERSLSLPHFELKPDMEIFLLSVTVKCFLRSFSNKRLTLFCFLCSLCIRLWKPIILFLGIFLLTECGVRCVREILSIWDRYANKSLNQFNSLLTFFRKLF